MTKGGKDIAPLKKLFQIETIWFVSRSQLQLAKCASRVALYLMREQELKEGTKDGAPGAGAGSAIDNIVQHSHDYFVISSCKVTAKLSDVAQSKRDEACMTIGAQPHQVNIPDKHLPGDVCRLTAILNK